MPESAVESVQAVTLAPKASTGVAESANLDFLRSFAVLAVLVAHSRTIFGITGVALVVGRTGVLLFFVHTALVLLQSLERMHAAGDNMIALRFYIQRWFRIYPLYLVAIAASLLFGIPAFAPNAHGLKWIVANLLMVQNLAFLPSVSAPMWSLPYEMQMYLALPMVYLIANQRERILKIALLSFFGALTAILTLAFAPLPFDALHEPITYFVPCFMGGAFAFALYGKPRRIPFVLLPALLLGLLVTLAICPAVALILAQWAGCAVLGIALPRFQEIQGRLPKSICRHVARCSYGVYLWHWPLLWLWFVRIQTGPASVRVLLFAASLATSSVISHRLIEAPLTRAGKALSANLVRAKHAWDSFAIS